VSKINNLKIEKFIVFERFSSEKGVVRSFFHDISKTNKAININNCVLILFEVFCFCPIHVQILLYSSILCLVIRTYFAEIVQLKMFKLFQI